MSPFEKIKVFSLILLSSGFALTKGGKIVLYFENLCDNEILAYVITLIIILTCAFLLNLSVAIFQESSTSISQLIKNIFQRANIWLDRRNSVIIRELKFNNTDKVIRKLKLLSRQELLSLQDLIQLRLDGFKDPN